MYLYTLSPYPQCPIFGPFRSSLSLFYDTMLSIIGNVPIDLRLTLEHLMVKSTLHTVNSYPRNFGPFRSMASSFQTQGCRKSKMHRLTLE